MESVLKGIWRGCVPLLWSWLQPSFWTQVAGSRDFHYFVHLLSFPWDTALPLFGKNKHGLSFSGCQQCNWALVPQSPFPRALSTSLFLHISIFFCEMESHSGAFWGDCEEHMAHLKWIFLMFGLCSWVRYKIHWYLAMIKMLLPDTSKQTRFCRSWKLWGCRFLFITKSAKTSW